MTGVLTYGDFECAGRAVGASDATSRKVFNIMCENGIKTPGELVAMDDDKLDSLPGISVNGKTGELVKLLRIRMKNEMDEREVIETLYDDEVVKLYYCRTKADGYFYELQAKGRKVVQISESGNVF